MSSIANRHGRSRPSAVSLRRSHDSQNGSVTDEMKPTPPGAPSANRNIVAASPLLRSAERGKLLEIASKTSLDGTTFDRSHV